MQLKCSSDASTRRLWYKRLDYSGGQIISFKWAIIPAFGLELSYNGMLGSACGNGPSCWIDFGTGGLGYPRVRGVHPVRHRLRPPIIDSVSRSTALLPGVLDGSRFCCSRLWNRSVFRVGDLLQPVRGVGSSSKAHSRERSSLRKSSRLQMVTLSQPATHSFRRGYANTCQFVASTEAIPVANEPNSSGEILNYGP